MYMFIMPSRQKPIKCRLQAYRHTKTADSWKNELLGSMPFCFGICRYKRLHEAFPLGSDTMTVTRRLLDTPGPCGMPSRTSLGQHPLGGMRAL